MLILKVAIGVLALYILFIVFLYFKQNSLVYYPPALEMINTQSLIGFQQVEIVTKDELTIKGYYLPPQPGKPVLIEFHGNASHPAWEASKFKHLVAKGYGVMLAEYRGYGGNPGTPSEDNLYLDGDAYINWIKQNTSGNSVVVYGSSIGSGVAVDIAKNHPDISALILEVPFNQLSLVGAFHFSYVPFSQHIMRNKFDNANKIKDVKVPVLIMLARQDAVVPIHFGQALADVTNEPKTIHIFEDANHINIYDYGAAEVVENFLNKHVHD